jgi:hypothetical protein
MARRFVELGLARAQFLDRVDAGDAHAQGRHFGRQLADGQGQRVFLGFQTRQGFLDRFQALGLAGQRRSGSATVRRTGSVRRGVRGDTRPA